MSRKGSSFSSVQNERNTSSEPRTHTDKIIGKIKYVILNISVEPLVLLYLLPSVMNYMVTQNLYLEKACRLNLAYNVSTCNAMSYRNTSGYTEEQDANVQKYVSKMMAIKTFVQGFFPVCLVMFVGSWSDRHGKRRPLILCPLIAELMGCFLLILSVIFFAEIPLIVTVLSDSLPLALAGGYPCLFLGLYSYVSSISDEENRTARIGAVSTVHNASMIIGMAASGSMIKALGFTTMYGISATMMLSAVIYGFVVVKDKKMATKIESLQPKKGFIRDFFNFKNIVNIFKVCFKRGSGNRRYKIMAIMLLSVMILGPMSGEFSVLYLFTRYKFGWSEFDYSSYCITQTMLQIFGSTIAVLVFSKCFQWHDATLGIIAIVSSVSARIVYAFAPSGFYMYIGSAIEIFYGTCHIAVRSLMAKIVPPEELGQSYAVFGICEAFVPLLFGPLYTLVYNYTIDYLPGAFFLWSSVIKFLGLLIFIWIYKETIKDSKQKLKCESVEKEKLNPTHFIRREGHLEEEIHLGSDELEKV